MIRNRNATNGNRRWGVKGIAAIGLPFFAAGLIIASALHWTSPSVAEEFTGGTHASVDSLPVMPGSFAKLAAQLSPTVVNVKVTKVKEANFHGPVAPDGPFGDLFERFFQQMPDMPRGYQSEGAGSGVIISDNGYILSNNHVVEGATEVTVTLADQKEYPAKVVGRDPKTDLAVLKIDAEKPLPSAALGDSDKLQVGDWVVAVGNPFGLSQTVTSGIVSAKGRVIGAGPYDDFIQTDASINPGNSGGPLFNLKGEIVGINTAIIPQGQGIGFAIPVNTAKPLIPQLVETGTITRGYLGVNIQTLTPDLAKALKVEEQKGILVADVVPGSPAEKGGIERGDIIVSYNGKDVDDSHKLPAMVAATPVNEKVAITVIRNGKKSDMSVTVGKLEPKEGIAADPGTEPFKSNWGLQLHDLGPEIERHYRLKADKGVVVVGVEPGSPADEAGLQQGDVIVEVNRQPVNSVDEVKESVSKSEGEGRLLILVQRQDGKFYVPLKQQQG